MFVGPMLRVSGLFYEERWDRPGLYALEFESERGLDWNMQDHEGALQGGSGALQGGSEKAIFPFDRMLNSLSLFKDPLPPLTVH